MHTLAAYAQYEINLFGPTILPGISSPEEEGTSLEVLAERTRLLRGLSYSAQKVRLMSRLISSLK